MIKIACPLCSSRSILQDHGELICMNCGLIIQEQAYETNPHTRNTLLTTVISMTNRDGKGNFLEKAQWIRAAKLRRLHKIMRIMSYEERVLSKAIAEVNKTVSKLNLPNFVKDSAINIFINTRKMKKRLSIDATIIASIYAACKMYKIPKTIDEICFSKKDKRNVWKIYRFMTMNGLVKNTISSPEVYISKICNLIGVKSDILKESYEIIYKARKFGLINGKSPYRFAVATVYRAMEKLGYKYSKSKMSRITGVSDATIRKLVRIIKDL